MGGRGKGGDVKTGEGLEYLRPYAEQYLGSTTGIRDTLTAQIQEALTTGGVGAQIPLAQKSVENIGQAGAASQAQIKENLAASGMGRTVYGQRLLAESAQGTGLAQSQAMTDIAKSMMSLAPNWSTGGFTAMTPVVQGELGYEGLQTSRDNSKRAFNAQVMSSVIQASSSAAGGAS